MVSIYITAVWTVQKLLPKLSKSENTVLFSTMVSPIFFKTLFQYMAIVKCPRIF